ncbi:MAG: hypothetical protein JJ920_05060 [Roseitalea sp.]|nr:hypothetical protein [Roseitalea sp.]MBO6721257.1 hypothetical protein [Roseitalea sp.]MBO6742259.1 hypothetical protein [Roseitalea sp.]
MAMVIVGLAAPAHTASITNQDSDPRTLVVTENGVKSELVIGAGETVSFCASGCFITLPNGDRAALAGGESIELVGSDAIINP